jgi:hypothetical protein
MIVASMIEAVIMPRFATGARASLLTRCYPPVKGNYYRLTISSGDEFYETSMGRS